MDRLKNKVAIITGAASGLGEADARMFAQEGARVVLADINEQNGRRIAQEIGPNAEFVRLDVRREPEWQEVIHKVVERYGRLDILVNNAGVSGIASPEKVTEEQLHNIMSVSVDGTVFGCKHAILSMKKTGGGSIINMSSVASVTGEFYCAAYCAAKGAIEAYTRAVAVHCAQNRLNIRCNSVHPAAIETQMAVMGPDVMVNSPETWQDGWLPTALKNPYGHPNDVAYLLVYLASDESSFLSGQRLILDNTSTITMGAIPKPG
jgi:3(or 17)beta-hydroxysteroid dehydrogenase